MKRKPTKNAPKRRPAVRSLTAPGETLLQRFARDHVKKRLGTTGEVYPVVSFASETRTAVLFVAEVGGYLCVVEGKECKCKSLNVSEALSWYRRQIAENWFTQRLDIDDGWQLLLGMAEGLAARQIQKGDRL